MGYPSGVQGQAVLDANDNSNDDIVHYNYQPILNFPGLLTAIGDGKGNFLYKNALPGYQPTIDDFVDQVKGDFNGDGLEDLILHVALTANQASVEQGQPVSITATVKATIAARPQPTGTIALMEGSTDLGTGTLSGGSATISVSGLAVGTHTITAVYSGDSNFNVNSNASVSEMVTAPPPAPAVAVNASASFSGNVSFAVSGGSTGMSISLTPSQVTLTPGQSTTSVLVVSTAAPSSALQWPIAAGSGLSLAGLFLVAIPRRLRRKLSSFAVAILGAVALASALGLTGCCGGSGVRVAPNGPETLTITATPTGLTAQTVSVTVTVQ
jgi:Bacterial Ig-like domain (group 3)